MTVPQRLAAGASAGMTATTLTHPLDVVRLRLALPSSPYKGAVTGSAVTWCHGQIASQANHYVPKFDC